MDQIVHHLTSSKRVLLASHINPDGDAVGSLIALGLALKAMNKNITLFNESPIPAVYRFLPAVELISRGIDKAARYDCSVILDCGDLERIGSAAKQVKKIPTIINIDHHITNTGFGNIQHVDTSACATTEIIYRIIRKMGVPIDKTIATSVYTGIITDTGSFRFSNTNRAAFTICDEMMKKGVAPYEVAQHVYGAYSLGRIKLLNLALDSIEISDNGKLSIMTVTPDMLEQTGTQPEDTDGLIQYARRIKNVKVAALIQEYRKTKKRGRYHVSLRSDGSVNVAEIAAAYGGGGHFSASGYNSHSSLSDIKFEVMNLAETI